MAAVWMRARAELRAGWRGVLALVLLVGVAGGTAIGAAAGARRTETAFPRMLAATNASDFLMTGGNDRFFDAVARRPDVLATGRAAGCSLLSNTTTPGAPRRGELLPRGMLMAFASVDGQQGFTLDRPKLLAGRMPDPARADEVLANHLAAERLGLTAGERVRLFTSLPDAAELGPPVSVTVTGVGVEPNEVIPLAPLDGLPTVLVTPAYFRQHDETFACGGFSMKLRPGTEREAFRSALTALLVRSGSSDELLLQGTAERTAKVQRAIRPQAVALWGFAGIVALAGALTLGQILGRQIALAGADYPTLRAMGASRGTLLAVVGARVGLVGVAGGALAVGVAALGSPLMPIGPARLAEPVPGFELNAAVLAAGFGGALLLIAARSALPAWRAATGASHALETVPRSSTVARAVGRIFRRPSAAAGVRMALEPGRGRTAVPVRSALAETAAGIATVVAAFTFGASLNHLVGTPRLYGWNWDASFDAAFGTVPMERFRRAILQDRDVEAVTGGTYTVGATVGGRTVPAIGVEPVRGPRVLTVLDGREPRRAGEIALGARTLRAIGGKVGDRVPVALAGGEARGMTIVGRVVFPGFGFGSFGSTSLGEGAALPVEAVSPGAPPNERYNFLLLRYRPGADADADADAAAVTARLERRLGSVLNCTVDNCRLTLDLKPTDIANYRRVRSTPVVLAGLLALMAGAALAHTLVTSVRRRRADLAVLKTLGLVRRQVAGVVAWQSGTIVALGLAVGIPAGAAAGRWLWRTLADQLGISPEPRVPIAALLLAIPLTFALGQAVAALPGRAAARTRPAVILRTE